MSINVSLVHPIFAETEEGSHTAACSACPHHAPDSEHLFPFATSTTTESQHRCSYHQSCRLRYGCGWCGNTVAAARCRW